jgi:hypothetical protein
MTGCERIDGAAIELYWLPLGSGQTTGLVRWSGRLFESATARLEHRPPCDLYHSALAVSVDAERFIVEMAPVWGNRLRERGVVCEGAVGLPALGHSQFFRYEVRRWRGGSIADVAEAVDSPITVSRDSGEARRLLALLSEFPTLTWGRDELHTGDMWNSNSLVAWLLVRSGEDTSTIRPPHQGRAPGWLAGEVIAARWSRAGPRAARS